MKLVYSREGGLFPQIAQTEVQTADLPAHLRKLVDTVLADPSAYTGGSDNPNLRDGYQYQLDLHDGKKKISLKFDDLSLPEDVQPLIHYLQQQTGKP